MKIIAIGAVTAGGKTTVVNAIKDKLPRTAALFIDTPLDLAMSRRVLQDMKAASADDIRNEMEQYLNYERITYVQMLKDIMATSDYVIDGANELESIVREIMEIIVSC